MKKYIHYGITADEFDKKKVTERVNALFSKPDRGFWASPVNTDWGWKDWCTCNDFRMDTDAFDKSFRFRIDKKAKILRVRNEDDIMPFVIPDNDPFYKRLTWGRCKTSIGDRLDRDRLYETFDGMELFLSENYYMHEGIFNSWDCDSIVIWNPDVILPIKEV